VQSKRKTHDAEGSGGGWGNGLKIVREKNRLWVIWRERKKILEGKLRSPSQRAFNELKYSGQEENL